jgi:hypothetical protein
VLGHTHTYKHTNEKKLTARHRSHAKLEEQVYDTITQETDTKRRDVPEPVRLSFPYPSLFYGDDILGYLRNILRNLPPIVASEPHTGY